MEYMQTNICFIVLCVIIFFQSNILTFICRRKEKVWKHGFVNLKGIGVKFLKRILLKVNRVRARRERKREWKMNRVRARRERKREKKKWKRLWKKKVKNRKKNALNWRTHVWWQNAHYARFYPYRLHA